MSDLAFFGLAVLALLLIGSPSAVILWVISRRAPAQDPALPCQAGTPAYRGDRLAIEPPRDGALLGFAHPLGWPVRIVMGIPVAIGPDGRAAQWSRALMGWTHCYSDLAEEARSRLQMEETREDDSLPVAEPVGLQPGGSGGAHAFDAQHWCVNCGSGRVWAERTGTACFGRPGEAERARDKRIAAAEAADALGPDPALWVRQLGTSGNGDEA